MVEPRGILVLKLIFFESCKGLLDRSSMKHMGPYENL